MACAVVVPNCEPWGRSPSPDTHWFALYTHPNAEGKVCHGLSRLGIEHYLPTCKMLTRWRFGHRLESPIETTRPLFPGYVFVYFNPSLQGIRKISEMNGASRFVSFGILPAELSAEDITNIRVLELSGLPMEDCKPLTVGQTVLVEHGPLAGAYGKVEQIDDATYLVISLSIFGRSKRVKVSIDWLEAA